jgi:thiamine biosynthesis lipoprotein
LYKQVAVIHPESWMADVISTALFILPVAEGGAMALSLGAEAFWIDIDGNWFATPGYSRFSNVF